MIDWGISQGLTRASAQDPLSDQYLHQIPERPRIAGPFWYLAERQSAIHRKAVVRKQWISPTGTSANGQERNNQFTPHLLEKNLISAQ
jgi:hypothetical protein